MGEAEARLFAAGGAKVVMADILSDGAETVAAAIRTGRGEVTAAKIDVKGFGCRPGASGRPGREPASESLRRRNPRESDGCLAVYGDLARQELWQGMVFAGSLRAESR